MADVLVLIEEQRAVIRDTERELSEALGVRADLDKKILHLQWMLERLKRLYALTSSAAQDEAGHARRLVIPPMPTKPKEANGRTGQPGTVKQAIVDCLRENRRPMTAREVWEVLAKQGVRIRSERPAEVVASTMRSSMMRNQNIFSKDGPKFGLIEWQASGRTA